VSVFSSSFVMVVSSKLAQLARAQVMSRGELIE
jgi:hypothetical protein